MAPDGSAEIDDEKAALRRRLLTARASLASGDLAAASDALQARALGLCVDRRAEAVCCYWSTPEEPGTHRLLDRLVGEGVDVLLPVTRPDLDLDWAPYRPGELRTGRFGIAEPTAPPRGVEALSGADVVICPGLAVDGAGNRLGRGGGSYDRALARLSAGTLRVVLVYDDEVLDAVPAAPHDQRVDVAVTPRRTLRFPAAGR